MTNQTDQGVTIDREELRSLSNDMLMDVLHDCCNDRHPEFNTYWKEIMDRLNQPAPPVPGVEQHRERIAEWLHGVGWGTGNAGRGQDVWDYFKDDPYMTISGTPYGTIGDHWREAADDLIEFIALAQTGEVSE